MNGLNDAQEHMQLADAAIMSARAEIRIAINAAVADERLRCERLVLSLRHKFAMYLLFESETALVESRIRNGDQP